MKILGVKEISYVIFSSLFVGFVLSYPSFNGFAFLSYSILYFTTLLGKLLILKKISFENGIKTEFTIFLPSILITLFLLVYGIKIPIPGYLSFYSLRFNRYKFFNKRMSVDEVGRIVFYGNIVNLLLAFVGVIFKIKELLIVNVLQIIPSLIPFEPFEGGFLFFYDYFTWIAMIILSLILIIFG